MADAAPDNRPIALNVIIRTLADRARKSGLQRAIESVQAITSVRAHAIVVANGSRYDPELLDSLQSRGDLTLVYMEEPSAGKARVLGRSYVAAPYFMYLDDDDELIPEALDSVLKEHFASVEKPRWDVLVTNRLCELDGALAVEYSNLALAAAEPMAMLLNENWLSPGASIFATQAVNSELIDVGRDHHEWTHIGFRLAYRDYKLKFVDIATAVYRDTELSLSKLKRHEEQELDMLRALAQESVADSDTAALIDRKYRNLLHVMAARSLDKREYKQAWRYHLKSMCPPHTFRYILFSREFLFRCVSRA
jgi:glycosyltransferase involved in cell wall biosynthesis